MSSSASASSRRTSRSRVRGVCSSWAGGIAFASGRRGGLAALRPPSLGLVLLAQAVTHGLLPALGLAAGPVAAVGQLALPPLLEVEVAVALRAVRSLAALDGARVLRAALRLTGPALLLLGGRLFLGSGCWHRPLLSGPVAPAASEVQPGMG